MISNIKAAVIYVLSFKLPRTGEKKYLKMIKKRVDILPLKYLLKK
jgi:hypothetical protein